MPKRALKQQDNSIKYDILLSILMKLILRVPRAWPLYLLASLILLLALVSVLGERGVLHLSRLRGEKHQLDEQIYRLQKANEALRQRIVRIRNDNHYLEKLAREELNLVRPGEVVYRFPQPTSRTGGGSAISGAAAESHPSKEQKSPR